MEAHKFTTVDEYISTFPQEVRQILEKLRQTIIKAAPKAEEVISYNMPAFKLNGMLVYYAGYKKHIGFYPTNSGITEFADELTEYKTSKGAVQFPLDKPLPIGLITKIVKFRIMENNEKALAKKKK
ncbi:MAG: DUF1801 domain-containing protein [Sporocytophaga sp.]|nr:DUF1801 domain-containing protein [Sporocytophaga sp.]